jgi:hypothetical protein
LYWDIYCQFYAHVHVQLTPIRPNSLPFPYFIHFYVLTKFTLADILIKLHNEELHNLYSSPNIIRMIKSRRRRWAGHVARMGAKRSAYWILVRKPKAERPLGRSTRSGWTILKWILQREDGM